MIGLLTIGLIVGLALHKKRAVSGIGRLSRFEWIIYRDLIERIEQELMDYIEFNSYDPDDYDDYAPLDNPRLDISVSPNSRTGYDFDVIIDEYNNFKYPNKTYDVERLITTDDDGYYVIDYEELEYLVRDFLDSRERVAGIGAAKFKRRIYQEIADLQKHVDFTYNSYDDQTEDGKRLIERNCRILNEMYPRRKRQLEPRRYYNQLRRAYNSIAGIGETTLPFRESQITNDNGDVILVYRDYGTQHMQLMDAIDWLREVSSSDPEEIGYNETLIYLASGGKLVWNDSKNKVHRGLQSEILARGSNAERKKRISIIAHPNKGGLYPDGLAHRIWELYGSKHDDYYIKNGVLSALLSFETPAQAQDEILRLYYNAHTKPEEDEYLFFTRNEDEVDSDPSFVDEYNDSPF